MGQVESHAPQCRGSFDATAMAASQVHAEMSAGSTTSAPLQASTVSQSFRSAGAGQSRSTAPQPQSHAGLMLHHWYSPQIHVDGMLGSG